MIDLPLATVEGTLSQMILDKKFKGILDAGQGSLIAYQDGADNTTYETSIEVIENMGKVVDSLYNRASRLS
jgi:26S proteasome regulatory subunit N6